MLFCLHVWHYPQKWTHSHGWWPGCLCPRRRSLHTYLGPTSQILVPSWWLWTVVHSPRTDPLSGPTSKVSKSITWLQSLIQAESPPAATSQLSPLCIRNTGTLLSAQSFPDPFHQPRLYLCPEPKRSAASWVLPVGRDARSPLLHRGTPVAGHTLLLAIVERR